MADSELVVRATLADVARATEALRALLPQWLSGGERDAIELALAEALTNIVEHGFGSDSDHQVRLRVRERATALEIDVWDQ